MRNHKEEMKKNAANFLYYSYFRKVKGGYDFKWKNMDETVCFLIYSYFGERKEKLNSENKIIETAIARAYQDATLLGAYNTLLPKPKDGNDLTAIDLRLQSAAAYEKAVVLMKTQVKELLDYDKDFDNIHKRICVGSEDKKGKSLVDIYNNIVKEKKNGEKVLCFTPGNAQKWVNMTMKNLYVICGILMICDDCTDVMEAFCEKVLNRAQFFHIPVDSYILKAWKALGMSYIKINKSGTVYIKYKKDGDNYTLSDLEGKGTLTTAWSAMEDYQIYQELWDKCPKKIFAEDEWPIEWESEKWIEVSESR